MTSFSSASWLHGWIPALRNAYSTQTPNVKSLWSLHNIKRSNTHTQTERLTALSFSFFLMSLFSSLPFPSPSQSPPPSLSQLTCLSTWQGRDRQLPEVHSPHFPYRHTHTHTHALTHTTSHRPIQSPPFFISPPFPIDAWSKNTKTQVMDGGDVWGTQVEAGYPMHQSKWSPTCVHSWKNICKE